MTIPSGVPPEMPGPRGPVPSRPGGPGLPGPDLPGPPEPEPIRPVRPWPLPHHPESVPPARFWPQTGSWPDRLHEQLFARRIVLVHGHVGAELATTVCAQLMTLDGTDDEPIKLQLNTPDADLEAAFAIVDTIDGLAVPVHATAIGEVGGGALAILAAAQRRQATRNTSLRLGEPKVRFEGTASDLAAREEQHRRLVDALYSRLSEVTGREVDEIRDDATAGRFLTAEQAVAYGLISSLTPGREPPPGF
jgi:ATP-dependent Clp protease protease subunit